MSGIRLRAQRGAIGRTWWAVALRERLEAHLGPARATAGRRLARAGRVQWIDVAPQRARGGVLGDDGSLAEPEIDLRAFLPGDREVFVRIALSHPELPAALAGGDFPQAVEEELRANDVTLLPRETVTEELSHNCSCPDWPGPCVHVAALAYVLVEAVEEHPLHLLTLRGLQLGDLVAPAPTRGPAPDHARGARSPDGADPAPVPSAGEADPAAAPSADMPAADPAPQTPQDRVAFDPALVETAALVPLIGERAAEALGAFYRTAGDVTSRSRP
ncbi:SWIM zinc finger family protein [Brachybacterium sp. EF45031]|uniref:SWIM zinc finger family protein n=1 Tax=Brachybacterium sillae TaxID=2810536 RepID=UPI00217D99B9|nr:SWIM zinc finger family protein [Brachybacterium sillae]MCS6711567.1 SWIM zinc finger family protein [Brachybacterium sillae]